MSLWTPEPSTKSVSGAGYLFEDKVASLFMAEMLCGQAPLRPGRWGIPWRIRRQQGQLPSFDDVVLDFHDSSGSEFLCAISVKSNLPSKRVGLTAPTVHEMWDLLDSGILREADHLGIACQPLAENAKYLDRLLPQSLQSDPEVFKSSILDRHERSCFESFQNPKDEVRNPALLIRKLAIRHDFDFESINQDAERKAIHLCRQLLSLDDEQQRRSRDLWEALLTISVEMRVARGSRTIPQLIAELKNRFPLADAPDDRAEWRRVNAISQSARNLISESLPNGIVAPRKAEVAAIHSQLVLYGVAVIIGESGSGKSALAKVVASAMPEKESAIIWLSQPDFQRIVMTSHELVALIQRSRRSQGMLVLDGAEHWHKNEDIAYAKTLIKACQELSGWQCIITCQQSEWFNRISRQMYFSRNTWEPYICQGFSDADFVHMVSTSDQIARLASHPRLRNLIQRPQMLRAALEASFDVQSEAAESCSEVEISKWWWFRTVCDGQPLAPEGTFARLLAQKMADALVIHLPETDAKGYEDQAVQLMRRGVLQFRNDARKALQFSHDLYADWARLRHLEGLNEEKLLEELESKIDNPAWFRALCLLMQQWLESDEGLERWKQAVKLWVDVVQAHDDEFQSSRGASAKVRLADAALDALIRCGRPALALAQCSDILMLGECVLLRRLIRSMAVTATVPDLLFEANARDQLKLPEAEIVQLRRVARMPQLVVWGALLEFLVAHIEQVVPAVSLEIAHIMSMFYGAMRILRNVGIPDPTWWSGLCEVMVACGERELLWEIEDVWRPSKNLFGLRGEPRTKIYEAVLTAADQHPDRVAALILKAAGRLPWAKKDLPDRYDIEWIGQSSRFASLEEPCVVYTPKVWEDGPSRKVSNNFQDACLKSGALAPLMEKRPAVVVEAVLSFCINWPQEPLERFDVRERWPKLSLSDHDWYPPFYSQGPFLTFLRIDQTHAIDLIVQIINVATDDHMSKRYGKKRIDPLEMKWSGGVTVWRGDAEVLAWHYWNGHNLITSSLMALEKWMLEKLASNGDIEGIVNQLFTTGGSVALAGTLITLGKHSPELFLGILKPLLFVPEFIECDAEGRMRSWVGNSDLSFSEYNLLAVHIKEWHAQKHRCVSLSQISIGWITERPEFRSLFSEVAKVLRGRAAVLEGKAKRSLFRLAWKMEFTNWAKIKEADGQDGWSTQIPVQFLEPSDPALNRDFDLQDIVRSCLQLLQNNQPLADAVASEWWDAFETVIGWRESSADSKHDNALAAMICLFLRLGEKWLRRETTLDPIGRVTQIAIQILPDFTSSGHDNADRENIDCQFFMAIVIARLWACDSKSAEWQACAAKVAMAFRYDVVRALFGEAWLLRSKLGQGFEKLFHLLLAYSEQRGPDGLYPDSISKIGSQLLEWRQNAAESFLRGDFGQAPLDWGGILGSTPDLACNQLLDDQNGFSRLSHCDPNPKRLRYGFDAGLVVSALQCVPATSQASNSEEAIWSNIAAENLSTALLKTLPDNVPSDSRELAQCYKIDHQILRRLAARLLSEGMEASGIEPFWKKLLAKGPNATRFVTHFADDVKQLWIRSDDGCDVLKLLWTQMLEFMLSSPIWRPLDGKHDQTAWDELLFVFQFRFSEPAERFGALICDLKPYYQRTISSIYSHGFRFNRYLSFFAHSKAATPLILDLLMWLHPIISDPNKIAWKDSGVQESLSKIAEAAWQQIQISQGISSEQLSCLRLMVSNLAALQNIGAIEIQSQMGSRA